MTEETENARRQIPKVKEIIERNTGDRISNIFPINNERQFILETNTKLKYQMIFKRDFFRSFGKIFGYGGLGESLNEEIIQWALKNGIHNLIFIYENGYAYTIPVNEFFDYSISHGTIRKTEKTGETTMSIPLSMLRRWR
jgi:hypothetical protein